MAKTAQNFVEEADTADGIFTLSSGVKVRFNQLPASMSQEVFTKLLRNTKINKDGTIAESNDPQKNLELLDKMSSYYATLIAFGVTMVGIPSDYYGVIDSKWLKKLKRAGYDLSDYDLEDEDDVEFLFLRYQGFASQEDWTLLSEKVLTLPT